MNDIQAKIANLEQQLAALKKQVETPEPGPIKPLDTLYQTYYFIDDLDHIHQDEFTTFPQCKQHAANFNYYFSKEKAQKEARYMRALRKLRHMARELDSGKVVIVPKGDTFDTVHVENLDLGAVGFRTHAAAKLAFLALTPDDLEALFS